MSDTPLERYERARSQAEQELAAGRLEEALAAFDHALALAPDTGDPETRDKALCNRAAVAIELGRGNQEIPHLRQVLLRASSAESSWLASYTVARAHELDKQFKKGIFYARIALNHADSLGKTDWRAYSHNQLGNLQLAESYPFEAVQHYERALDLGATAPPVWRARILDNLGYCRVLDERFDEGFKLLYESLRTLRRAGAERYQISTHLDLSYAHLQIGRLRTAQRHGLQARELAERYDEPESIKNALYLVGEAANLSGDEESALASFRELGRFFPDRPFVPDFLMAIDVRQVINLKA